MKSSTIIILTGALFAILVGGGLLIDGLLSTENTLETEVVPVDDPIDVSLALANGWLENQRATTSASLAEFLSPLPYVTDTAKAQLSLREETSIDQDPITCQSELPVRVGARPVFTTNTDAEVMIIPRGGVETGELALVTLALQEASWVITNVTCSNGEIGPEPGEFTFAHVGRLAQSSVPAPYDNTAWHLLFTNEIDLVQVVPLLFDAESQCASGERITPCESTNLVEGSIGFVQGDLTEAGVIVRRLETE